MNRIMRVMIAGAVGLWLASEANAQTQGRGTPKASPARPRVNSNVPAGRWIGQDGHDVVGPSSTIAPSDVQDVHIAIGGLPRNAVIALAKVTALGGGEWLFRGPYGPWAAQIEREPGSPHADLYIEPGQVESGRPFQVLLQFEDGRKVEFDVAGGKADPNLRAAGAAMSAKWVGPEKTDRVGNGPSVGPDGVPDAKITLSKLSKGIEIVGVVVSGAKGQEWHSGVNPRGFASAELVRRGDDPSTADLLLGFDRDPKGQPLTITVHYANSKTDTAKIVAGSFDPKAKTARVTAPSITTIPISAQWLGQDDTNKVGPGDVHVRIGGLPRQAIIGAALSNASGGLWEAKLSDKRPFEAGSYALPMSFLRGSNTTTADLRFPPFRDETGGAMTLRLLLEDGKNVVGQFPGGKADAGLRAGIFPTKEIVTAKPGDDLNALARRFGTIRLADGRHVMLQPLVLEKPVTIQGSRKAIVAFSQAPNDPTWAAAIKIHSGHTSLEGFSVRFETPVRWTAGIDGGPAVIGTTDNKDTIPGDFKADVTVRAMDLEGPPASSAWEEAPRLLRLAKTVCGTIEGNTLKGGATEIEGGPWTFANNTYLGTQLGTFAYSVISVRYPHDLIVKGNTAKPISGTGKTWRFLVMTGSGHNDVIEENTVANIGPKDDDTKTDNAPEIILTEAYSLHFEGKPAAVSADGRVVVIPGLQGEPARSGDAVAILTGPKAGEWRRIVQAMGKTTYLLDAPLPAGEPVISIATGFIDETFRKNTVDARGGSVAANLVLAGNHFGLNVTDNHLIGGGETFRIVAAPTESPVHWGWSHAPLMGATIANNTIEDSLRGGTLCVEHSKAVKTSRGRVYGSAVVKNNTFRWNREGSSKTPIAMILGDPGSLDPSELVVQHEGNRVEGQASAEVRVIGANLNGKETRDKVVILKSDPSATAGAAKSPARR